MLGWGRVDFGERAELEKSQRYLSSLVSETSLIRNMINLKKAEIFENFALSIWMVVDFTIPRNVKGFFLLIMDTL